MPNASVTFITFSHIHPDYSIIHMTFINACMISSPVGHLTMTGSDAMCCENLRRKRNKVSVPWSRSLNLTSRSLNLTLKSLKSHEKVLFLVTLRSCTAMVFDTWAFNTRWSLTPEHTYTVFFPARLVPQQYHSNTTAPFTITSLNGSLVRNWTHQDPRCWWRSGSCRHYIWHTRSPHAATRP